MTFSAKTILVTMGLVVSATAHGQDPPTTMAAKAKAKAKIATPAKVKANQLIASRAYSPATLRKFQQVLAFNRNNPIFAGKNVDCSPGTPCNATAELTELFDSTGKLVSCSVKTGDINLTYGTGTPRFIWITWDLTVVSPSSPPADYTFEPENGLLILRNRNGSTGNKADNVSKTQVKIKHKYKIAHDEVHYYPLVLQTLSDGTESLCAAGDPKMVND